MDQLTSDPSAKPEDIVKIGDELELMVVRVNDVEGTAMLSKTRLDAVAGFEKVMNAGETGEILTGVVTEVIKAAFWFSPMASRYSSPPVRPVFPAMAT